MDGDEIQKVGASRNQSERLSFGSWVTFANQLPLDNALACMQAAHDAGVNFLTMRRPMKRRVRKLMGQA